MTAAPLDYAPGAPIRRRTRIRRVSLVVALVIATTVCVRYGPQTYRQARFLYLQHQCLAYTAPVDQVVYDENSPERLKQPGYIAMRTAATPVAAYIAPPLQTIGGVLPPIGTGAGRTAGSGATLFLHERRNAAGQSRLILVQRNPVPCLSPTFRYPMGLEVFVFDPATWQTASRSLLDWRGGYCENHTDDLRIFAGQIDADDASHFTIRYEVKGKSGLIDGRLNKTGDGVIIDMKSGPVKNFE